MVTNDEPKCPRCPHPLADHGTYGCLAGWTADIDGNLVKADIDGNLVKTDIDGNLVKGCRCGYRKEYSL